MRLSTKDTEKKTEIELLIERIAELEQLIADLASLQLEVLMGG